MSANFSNGSLHFPSIPTTHMKFTHISSLNINFCLEYPRKKPVRYNVSCASIRSKRNSKSEENAEAQELVRTLLKNFNYDKPLLSTLNKYVKLVRTEHCFLLFEELGKSDKWLQCLEVSHFSWKLNLENPIYSICMLTFKWYLCQLPSGLYTFIFKHMNSAAVVWFWSFLGQMVIFWWVLD